VAARKTERLVNLTILLLVSSRFVSKEHIRDTIEGYRGQSETAFQRQFERDKDELRALGVPIEMGSNDPMFDDEVGYRIPRCDFELPPIDFTPRELMVLGLASTVWQQASVADHTARALAKLRAAGVEPDPARLTALAPRLSAREAAFEPAFDAVVARQAITFRYRGTDEIRTVEPWRVAWRNNSWYLLGFDRGREAPRVFKLSRISDVPVPVGEPDAYDAPDRQRQDELLKDLRPATDTWAVVAIRGDRAPALRRRGEQWTTDVTLPSGFRAWRVPLNDSLAAPEIASFGADVLVLEPADLRADVVAHLRGVIGAHGSPAPGSQPADSRGATR